MHARRQAEAKEAKLPEKRMRAKNHGGGCWFKSQDHSQIEHRKVRRGDRRASRGPAATALAVSAFHAIAGMFRNEATNSSIYFYYFYN